MAAQAGNEQPANANTSVTSANGAKRVASGEKIRVTHIRTSHGIFGAERVILGLLQAADKDSFDMHVTLVGSEPGLNKDFFEAIKRMGIGVENFMLQGRLDWRGIQRLRHHLLAQEIDIIHCHDFKANFYGLMASLGTGIKKVTTVHGSTKDSLLLKLYLGFNEYFLIRFFDKIIAVSEHLKDELQGNFISPRKIAMIPNGVDLNFFDAQMQNKTPEPDLEVPHGKKVIGIIGRLFPDKGHKDLFNALKLLQHDFPDLLLLVVGGGPDEEELRLMRTDLGLQDRIIFAGVRHNMKKVFDAIDIFAMPSIREGLPMALLEAMLAEKPIVATKVGGMAALVGEGKFGRAVNANDPEGLAKEIKFILLNPEVANETAKRAASFVRSEFSAETMAQKTEALYREIV